MSNESDLQEFHGSDVVLFGCTIDMSNIFYDGVVQRLHREQWTVHTASSPGPVGERLFRDHAHIHALAMQRGISPLRDLVSLVRWVRLLAKVRPQVVVLGTPKASLLGGIAARILRVPHIVYFVLGLRAELTEGFLGRILSAAEHLTLRSAHHILAISPSLRRELGAAHPQIEGRVNVLGFGGINGVDTGRFAPPTPQRRTAERRRWNLPEGAFVAGFVGRLHPDKGGDFLLDLVHDDALSQLDIHLLVIGDIEGEALRARVDTLQSQGRLTVTGWVETPESAMAAVDIVLHPTMREGLGMVLLEAQAMQIPVVTNRVTGTVDSVQGEVGGFFAQADSIRHWADTIAALAADDGERLATGRRGREFVVTRFDRERVVTLFSDYLSSLRQ